MPNVALMTRDQGLSGLLLLGTLVGMIGFAVFFIGIIGQGAEVKDRASLPNKPAAARD